MSMNEIQIMQILLREKLLLIKRAVFSASTLVLVAGCTTNPRTPANKSDQNLRHHQSAQQPLLNTTSDKVRKKLLSQYSQWKGVPYQSGGMSKKGIDCSGFVYLTYQKQFDMQLPRTTKQLMKHGKRISKNKLKEGDLVFFKTGRNKRHVGIYMGNSRFMHASTSQGVIMSHLNNQYWHSSYWFSSRYY